MKKNSTIRAWSALVGFELRKFFLSPWMLALLVGLLLLNAWKLWDSYRLRTQGWAEYEDVYLDFYDRYSGPVTAENIREFMEIYRPLQEKRESMSLNWTYDPNAYTYSEATDEHFFRSLFYTELYYDYLYQNEAFDTADRANRLAELYSGLGNTFEVEKNRTIAAAFQGRRIPYFGDTRHYELLLNYDYSAMLVLLLCLFGLSGVFVTEKETEMGMLLRTTRRGGVATVAAKLTASLLFTVMVCALFFAEDFWVLQLLSGRYEAIGNPVYALRFFEITPLTLTVGQYFLWAAVIKTLGMLCCGCVILLVSCLVKRSLAAFLASFAALMAGVLLQEFGGGMTALKWCNPLELVIVRETVNRDVYVNLFGHAVQLHVFIIGGVCLTTAVLCAGILYCNRGRGRGLWGRRQAHAVL